MFDCDVFPRRFLIVPSMGQTLQVVMKEQGGLLSETAVLQLACRIVSTGALSLERSSERTLQHECTCLVV